MEGSEGSDEGERHDPGLSEAPTGAPATGTEHNESSEPETVSETDDQPAGAPETAGEDIDPEGGGASDTSGTPEASGGSI
jgi:hypothetical protein